MSLVCDDKDIDNCGDGSDLEDHMPSGCKGHLGKTPVQQAFKGVLCGPQTLFRLSLTNVTLFHSLYTIFWFIG